MSCLYLSFVRFPSHRDYIKLNFTLGSQHGQKLEAGFVHLHNLKTMGFLGILNSLGIILYRALFLIFPGFCTNKFRIPGF